MGDWREGAEIMLRCATNGNDNAPPGDSAYGFILSLMHLTLGGLVTTKNRYRSSSVDTG